MELNYKQIGLRVRSMRKIRKLTQAELAERTGLSVPYISHIENGVKQVSLQALVKIAEALECTADRLLYENQTSTCSDLLLCQHFCILGAVFLRNLQCRHRVFNG